jgi:hypothetical protein
MRGWGRAILGFLVSLALAGVARAEAPARCEIPIIQAQPGGSSSTQIDPQIGSLKPYLTKEPFTSYHDFKLVERKQLEVPMRGSASFTLPNNRQASLTFLGHIGGPGNHHRLRLQLVIDHTEKKHRAIDTTFTLDEGGVMLHVGQQHQGGVLILGVSCKTGE